MDNLSFESLPITVARLCEKIDNFERLLQSKFSENANDADELLTVQGAASFLHVKVPTIYGLISKGELPVMKTGKRCYFSKAELLEYVKSGRISTKAEINGGAESFVVRPKRK